jgi:hypothetical protein
MIHANLGCNIFAIQKQLLTIALLIKNMSRNTTFAIYCAYCINKAVLCPGNTNVEHISEEFLNS